MVESTAMTDENDNLTSRYLRTLRRDMTAVLENQARDRQLVTRRAARIDQSVGEIRRDVADLRSDVVLLENGLLNRHNEILSVMRRMDDLGETLSEGGDPV